ncbi:ATP-binding cassette domain-containing protein [Prolixibacteraceae bacterium JC049]|nr:ATP-binding cassette domain-containing protein [Prolixibacteraceae bacterium JC049]
MNFIIKRKVLISMLFIGLSLLGYISYKQLPVELQPNTELPVLYVQISSATEVTPKYFENQAVIPVEGAVGTMEGIESIESWIYARQASIMVQFKKNVSFKYTFLKLQEKIDQIKSTLPEGFYVQVNKVDMQQLSNQFMELQIRGSGGTDRVRNVADQEIKPELENLDGIASANIYGGKQKSIEVEVDKAACEAYGITASQIRSALSQNSKNRTFSGYLHETGKQYFVHVTAEYSSVNDIEDIVLAKGPILLKDVAEVSFGVKEETSYSRVNGKDAVSMLLVSDAQTNLIDLSHRTTELLDKLNAKLSPSDIQIVVQENSAEEMEKNINQIIQLALLGGLLAIFVLWMFLKNIRLVAFIALSMPISIYTAFNFFYAAGISINSLTLVGMALAIGMLLDNSVVVLENIYRLSSNKTNVDEAVTQGTKEVWRSILAATFTTITVFLPFVFSDNFLIKMLGKNIGVSIISTLVVSLLVALLLIPMVAHYLLRKKQSVKIFYEKVTTNNRIIQVYVLFLKACMRYPARTIIGAVVFFFLTVITVMAISVNSQKEVQKDQFSLYVTMPSGSSLDATDDVTRSVETRLEGVAEIQDVICKVKEEEAIVTIKLKEKFEEIAKREIAEIKSDVEKRAKGVARAQISLSQPTSSKSFRGGGGSRMKGFNKLMGIGNNEEHIIIKGQDFDLMRDVAEDIKYYVENLESVRSTNISSSRNRPEIHLLFNSLLLTEYGIQLSSIASEFNSFSREFSSNVKFKHGTDEYDIMIKEKGAEEAEHKAKSVEDLRRMQIKDPQGGIHDLQELARVLYSSGMANIRRVNQEKQIEIYYRFANEAQQSKDLLESYRREIDDIIAAYNLPSGVAVEVVHEEDPFKDFKFLILAAFILIFMILASVFESISIPFVLLFSIPLAAIGSFLGLIFTGNSLFNANTLTGFLILLGVVVNNGIILIDYTQILRRKGYRKTRALMMAGISRVRPILITAITTIIALFPLAMGDAEYVGVIGAPFAITVIGGLALSTVLTLVFIPTFYSGLEGALNWMRNLPLAIKLLNYALMIGSGAYIYLEIDSFIYQMICVVLTIVLVPGITYFVMSSLRRASTRIIDEEEELIIKIQNLVKIYERPGRFVREWRGGIAIREHAGVAKTFTRLSDFKELIWQIPLLGFLIYFTFIYMENGIWMFLVSHAVFFMAFGVWHPIRLWLLARRRNAGKEEDGGLVKWGTRLLLWGLPLIFIFQFDRKWDDIGGVILIGVLWFLAILIFISSEYIHKRKINIDRITGRLGGLRRGYFRLVKKIPVIGKRKVPFKALNGVSLEIKTGMFGLLGPNGAGKSTMMRVICGIFEQSYGKIWINGKDTQKYREELQGLIGYLPQEFGTYENMSAYEFLDYQAMLKGIKDEKIRSERLEYVLKAVHMFERKDEKIGAFSGGMKQRIGIAQILLHLPRILVVDEPTAGLDPRERIRFRNLLVELSRERIVIFSTHIIEDISSSCNQVAVINRGQVRYTGDPQDMVHLGEGLVWQFTIPASEWEDMEDKHMVVHHMQDGDEIRIRCLAEEAPTEDAIAVTPHLEDAYLCLLKGLSNKNK